MSKFDFYKTTKRFILGESNPKGPSINGYLQSLEETITKLVPRSKTDGRRLEMAMEALRGVRRHCRRLQHENITLREEKERLEEQLKILEESKTDKEDL